MLLILQDYPQISSTKYTWLTRVHGRTPEMRPLREVLDIDVIWSFPQWAGMPRQPRALRILSSTPTSNSGSNPDSQTMELANEEIFTAYYKHRLPGGSRWDGCFTRAITSCSSSRVCTSLSAQACSCFLTRLSSMRLGGIPRTGTLSEINLLSQN